MFIHILKDKKRRFVVEIFALFAGFFLVQLILVLVISYQVSMQQAITYLEGITERVKEDVTYHNGKWDISHYYADSHLPETYPLYIFAANGLVIDRWKPVHGFLDTADVEKLLVHQTPQTITTDANQNWRIVSKPIQAENRTIGVVTVATYNPLSLPVEEEDKKLQASMNKILTKIVTKNELIDTSNLDPREIPYDVSFQIVDNYNRIIIKNNNTNSIDQIPNFIDTSYIGGIINGSKVRIVADSISNESFLIVSTPILDKNNFVVGVVAAGKNISYIYSILGSLLIVELVFGGISLFSFYVLLHYLTNHFWRRNIATIVSDQKRPVAHIAFDKKDGVILVDETEIQIPYATNQYYLCDAVFSAPKKKWELDQLLEKFGEEDLTNWRKVYDAMVIINKKTSHVLGSKLIIVKDKTYQINPIFLSKLH